MAPNRVQTLRSSTKLSRPGTTRDVGELYVNFPDRQIGVVDPSKVMVDLVGIRFFSASTDYAVGDYVVQAGQLYRAKSAVTAAAFNASQWDLIYNKAQVDAADALKLDASAYTAADVLAKLLTVDGAGSGLDADTLDGLNSTSFATSASLTTYAPLASPSFSGNPTAPTPTAGDNDTSIATTQFVTSAITALNLSAYATLASPVFTGNPTGPTPSPGDNDTSLATTAFVTAAVSAGGFAPIASPVFTGDPRAPTPTSTDNDTSIATTAFVKGQGYVTDVPMDSVTYGRKNQTWSPVVGGAIVSDIAPSSGLANGQLWWESDTGTTYLYYVDADTSQWVQIAQGGVPDQTQTFVRKTGDTMSGSLTLAADPVNALDAATKQYADTKVSKAGDTMTGQLVMPTGLGVISNIDISVYTSSGTYTKRAGLKFLLCEIVAAGGGGGGSSGNAANFWSAGGGGGAGSYSRKLWGAASIPATVAYTVGAGGAATSGANSGGTGGGGTFNGMGVNGGSGGAGGGTTNSVTYGAASGPGGAAGGSGDFNVGGNPGTPGLALTSVGSGGNGGASVLGQGGRGGANSTGTAGVHGGGGGGGGSGSSGAAGVSGAGGNGLIIITEYF